MFISGWDVWLLLVHLLLQVFVLGDGVSVANLVVIKATLQLGYLILLSSQRCSLALRQLESVQQSRLLRLEPLNFLLQLVDRVAAVCLHAIIVGLLGHQQVR